MNESKMEKKQQREEQQKFNTHTNSVKPKNQNETHNVVKEAFAAQNNKY